MDGRELHHHPSVRLVKVCDLGAQLGVFGGEAHLLVGDEAAGLVDHRGELADVCVHFVGAFLCGGADGVKGCVVHELCSFAPVVKCATCAGWKLGQCSSA